MAILPIYKDGHQILRKKAQPVIKITKKIEKLIKDMLETMYDANGAGLAAPQIGISMQLVVIDVGQGPMVLINPVIVKGSGKSVDVEGCLSIPGLIGYVERFEQVTVEALDIKGRPYKVEGEGFLARALQHEIDHLQGILYTDKATNITKEVPVNEG
jgi:peptide deformylase